MVFQEGLSIEEKLEILSDAAKYDVACTSSGVDRKGSQKGIGNVVKAGICHSFSADGRCISLLKVLLSNECIFDCKYCLNRSSNDVKRATFTPEELCQLTIEFYRRNYIEGLFLSSGIVGTPNQTMELMFQVLYKLREEYHFNGYIHVKAIPGADSVLIQKTGYLADRMSINLELPTAEGLQKLAPHKTRKTILKPMKQIQIGIQEAKLGDTIQLSSLEQKILGLEKKLEEKKQRSNKSYAEFNTKQVSCDSMSEIITGKQKEQFPARQLRKQIKFVPAGQSTQMIIGATSENDYQILSVTESLYHNFDLKRVFYSAYVPINEDKQLPSLTTSPPLLREHRLYQADWLLRFYGFQAEEILSKEQPNFNIVMDPKCNWAMNHLEQFPVEINRAEYYTLLRVPGIGPKSAGRIVRARKFGQLDFMDLKKMGVVLKRAAYFITCKGKQLMPLSLDQDTITRYLMEDLRSQGGEKLPEYLKESNTYQQISMFDSSFSWKI